MTCVSVLCVSHKNSEAVKAGLHVQHKHKHKVVYTCDKHKAAYAGAVN